MKQLDERFSGSDGNGIAWESQLWIVTRAVCRVTFQEPMCPVGWVNGHVHGDSAWCSESADQQGSALQSGQLGGQSAEDKASQPAEKRARASEDSVWCECAKGAELQVNKCLTNTTYHLTV